MRQRLVAVLVATGLALAWCLAGGGRMVDRAPADEAPAANTPVPAPGKAARQPTTRPAAKDVRFFFAQITDTHLIPRRPLHTERTAQAVAMINELPLKLACVVHTGDVYDDSIEDSASRKLARDLFAKLTVPIHYLPGNHDILGRMGAIEGTAKAWQKAHGSFCRKAEYHGVVFLMVYTEAFAKGFEVEGVRAMAWLAKELKAAGGKPVLVFHHTPSVLDFYGGRFRRGWPQEARTKWVNLLNAHNVKAVIAGHFHRGEQHWLGRVPLYVAPPVARFWGRQGSWRLFEYHNGKLSYRTVYISD